MMMKPIVPEPIEVAALMPGHSVQMSAFIRRNSAIVMGSSASHSITGRVMMKPS
jgi:hypothetical protein